MHVHGRAHLLLAMAASKPLVSLPFDAPATADEVKEE
jgi:hypothetical protein